MDFQIKKLEHDILYLQQRGNQAGIFQPLVVPEGLPASSAEVIANLNEHLIVTLEVIALFLFKIVNVIIATDI